MRSRRHAPGPATYRTVLISAQAGTRWTPGAAGSPSPADRVASTPPCRASRSGTGLMRPRPLRCANVWLQQSRFNTRWSESETPISLHRPWTYGDSERAAAIRYASPVAPVELKVPPPDVPGPATRSGARQPTRGQLRLGVHATLGRSHRSGAGVGGPGAGRTHTGRASGRSLPHSQSCTRYQHPSGRKSTRDTTYSWSVHGASGQAVKDRTHYLHSEPGT